MRTTLAQWLGGKSLVEEVQSTHMVRTRGAPRRGTTELFKSYQKSPWLRGIVAKIADHIAAVPWVLYVKTNSRTGKAVRHVGLQGAGFAARKEMIRKYEKLAVLHEIDEHPVLDLIANANPKMSGVAARKVSAVFYELKGEIFWLLEDNGLKLPVEYWPIPPSWVEDTPAGGKEAYEIDLYGQRRKVPEENMIWIRDLNPQDPYGRGIGYGESLMDELATDEYAAKVAKNRFFNQGRPEMIVTVEGADQPTVDNAQAVFESKFRGWQKAHRTMWSSKKVTVQELQAKFADMQLLELRSWERQAFMTTFGMPPEIMGLLESSNRATITAAMTIFAREVLIPRLEVFRAELQRQLVARYDERLILDYHNPVPEDDDFILEALTAQPHAATRGEWRKIQGLEDRGDIDDVHLVPFNLMEIKPGQAPEPAEPKSTKDFAEELAGVRPVMQRLEGVLDKTGGLEDVIAQAVDVRALQDQLDPIFIENLEAWGNAALADIGVAQSFTMVDPFVVSHLENFSGTKIVGINETTQDAVRNAMQEGIRDGDGPAALANRISGVFEQASQHRAVTIARTEVVGSSNFGTWNAYKQSKAVEKKQWVSTLDDRVRDQHLEMNGVVTALDQPFKMPDGAEAMYPGETGVAHHDINERCTIVAVVENEFSEAQLATVWRKFDQSLLPWENQTMAAVRRAFAEQETAALKVLRSVLGS
jgi:HK97 family phage portal protein